MGIVAVVAHGLIHGEKFPYYVVSVNCNRVKTDVLKVYVLEFLVRMYYIYIYMYVCIRILPLARGKTRVPLHTEDE